MCQFKSGIVLRDESSKGGFRLLMSPWSESHSELCQIFKLNDTAKAKLYFARVEFSPPSMDVAYKPETYKLKIDEERTPDWFDDEMKEKVSEKVRESLIPSIIESRDKGEYEKCEKLLKEGESISLFLKEKLAEGKSYFVILKMMGVK